MLTDGEGAAIVCENQLELFCKEHPELQRLLDTVDKLEGPDSYLRTEVEGKIKHFYYQNPELSSILSNLRGIISRRQLCIQQTEVLAIRNTFSEVNQSDNQNNGWPYQPALSDNVQPTPESSSVGWLSMAMQTLNDKSFGCTTDMPTNINSSTDDFSFSFCELLQSGNDIVDSLVNGDEREFPSVPNTIGYENTYYTVPVDQGNGFSHNSQVDFPAVTTSDNDGSVTNPEKMNVLLSDQANNTSQPQDAESIRKELDLLLTEIANDVKNSMF